MTLHDYFDGVICLTHPHWNDASRDVAFQFASRFAPSLDTLFVEPRGSAVAPLAVESTEIARLARVTIAYPLGDTEVSDFLALVRERGILRPLLWISGNLNLAPFLDALPQAYCVYHATEAGLSAPPRDFRRDEESGSAIAGLLGRVNLVVAESRGVLRACRELGDYTGPGEVIAPEGEALRFADLEAVIVAARQAMPLSERVLKVAVVYSLSSATPATRVSSSLEGIRRVLGHELVMIPSASLWRKGILGRMPTLDLSPFDALILHGSLFSDRMADVMTLPVALFRNFRGPKFLMIDERADDLHRLRDWAVRIHVDVLVTSLLSQELEHWIPGQRFPYCTRYSRPLDCLRGNVNEMPVWRSENRETLIRYRYPVPTSGASRYAQDCYRIGTDVEVVCRARGLPVDIAPLSEVDEALRFEDVRATLGADWSDLDAVEDAGVPQGRGDAGSHAPSAHHFPRHLLQACASRTALILVEGEYAGILKPDRDYIPLRRDFANIDEVLAKLTNPGYLAALTAQAYATMASRPEFTVQGMGRLIERELAERVLQPRQVDLVGLFSTLEPHPARRRLMHYLPVGRARDGAHRARLLAAIGPFDRSATTRPALGERQRRVTGRAAGLARLAWRSIPEPIRYGMVRALRRWRDAR